VTFFGILVPLAVFAVSWAINRLTIYLSFFDWNGMAKKTFWTAELSLSDQRQVFLLALLNNVKWVGVTLFFPVLLGLVIAYGLRADHSGAGAVER
jgi:ABC-type sugar transport system permease subunit